MSALPVEQLLDAADTAVLEAREAIALARSYGPLRAVTPEQAPVVRAATDHDPRLLPKWQRHGEGIHEWAEPVHYTRGRTWVRTGTPVADATGRRQWRRETYTGRPHVNWRTRDHWLTIVVPAALAARPEALSTRRGGVRPETFLAYCRELSKYAHARTGRRCIVRVLRLAELLGVSKATVQRCQLAAEDLGLYVVMSPGRMLGEAETYAARAGGSYQRGMANEAALVIPAWLPREAVDGPLPQPARRPQLRVIPGGHDTPTSGRNLKTLTSGKSLPQPSGDRCAGKSERPSAARATTKAARPGSSAGSAAGSSRPEKAPVGASGRRYDPAALQVAIELVQRLAWLHGVRPGRVETTLRRFVRCRQPWTAGHLITAIEERNARLGRAPMTADRVRNPIALLAHYLRDLDPDADHPHFDVDRPGAIDTGWSRHRRLENQLAIEAHRHGAGAGQTPEVRQRAIGRIRADLEDRRDR